MTMRVERIDPFARHDLGACWVCGAVVTWEDERLIRVTLDDDDPQVYHERCFRAYVEGLQLFTACVRNGYNPRLAN